MSETTMRRLDFRPCFSELDQFYTKPGVAEKCWTNLLRSMKRLGAREKDYWFIEPAAGCGCFYQILPSRRRIGIDFEPHQLPHIESAGIERGDYLEWQPKKQRKYVVIGNPPFGKRGKLAVDFFNHSDFAEIIAFIVPVNFRKHFIHKKLLSGYSLIFQKTLPKASFYMPDGKDHAVNTEFQIWTRLPHRLKNLRENKPPPISHPDFEMRQYNNTKEALSVFSKPFDFGVPCQGYQDYSRRETLAEKCEKTKQWMLFSARNKRVRNLLMRIDYEALARSCATVTPGFRKNDMVKHYASLICRPASK